MQEHHFTSATPGLNLFQSPAKRKWDKLSPLKFQLAVSFFFLNLTVCLINRLEIHILISFHHGVLTPCFHKISHPCIVYWKTCIVSVYVMCNSYKEKENFSLNPFSTNVPFMDKSSSWFLLAKCLKNTYERVESLAQVFSCEFCEVSQNTFIYKTPLVAELWLRFIIAWNGEKEIVAFIGSLQAAIASFISAFTAVWNIKGKLKVKLKYVRYLLFPSLTTNVFVAELDIMNVNVTSRIFLFL